MVNNQKEFNEKFFNKEVKEIEIKRNRNFQGQLIIEDYSELEKLNLRDIRSIEKVVLRNLGRLEQCIIWNCGANDLIIDNCFQVKKLNLRNNSLTNLKFLANLDNLEELEIDGNAELVEILKPYQGDWKLCQKDIQELVELTQRPYEFRKSQEENKKLKEKQLIVIDNPIDFQKKYQKLKRVLHSLTKEEELKSKEIDKLATDDLIESVKEQKENLSNLEKVNQELKEKFAPFEQVYQKIEQKENELEELKKNCLNKVSDKETMGKKLTSLLELQIRITSFNDELAVESKENTKELITIKTNITSEELDKICELQSGIIKLQNNFNQRENQLNQVINNNYNITGNAIINSTIGDNADLSHNTVYPQMTSSLIKTVENTPQKAQIEQKSKSFLPWNKK